MCTFHQPTEIASATDNNSKLNCLLINSRSLCNKLVEFQGLVYGNDLDLIAVTETWLQDDILDNEILSEKTYSIFRKDREGNRRGGGVTLSVKANILAYRRAGLELIDSEILICELLPSNGFKITVCVCYRPPDCTEFIHYLENLLKSLHESNCSRICIVGDFNLPDIDWESFTSNNSHMGRDFCDLINWYFFTQMVHEATKISHNLKLVLILFTILKRQTCLA